MSAEPEVMGHEEETETEILAPPAQIFDSKTLAILQKSEIDQQIATAKKYPRQIAKLLSAACALVAADSESADESIYALPRGGKVIEGPSVRFAELMAYSWGNNRCGARVIAEDEETVTAQGQFFDLEANVAIQFEVKRRITDKKGNRYNSDMVTTTGNAACSIALRNAILRGIPKPIWRRVYAEARRAVAGDIKTLDARRTAMLKAFELMGVKREAVFAKLGVSGLEDVTLDHLVTLRGIYNSVRENEVTAQRAFAPVTEPDANLAKKAEGSLEDIKNKYAKPAAEQKPADVKPEPAATTPAAAPTELQQADEKGNTEPAAKEGPQVSDSTAPASGTAGKVDAEPGPVPEDDHGISLNFDEPQN